MLVICFLNPVVFMVYLLLFPCRLSDKRRNYFAQKAEAQKRLFRTTKRNEVDMSELEKKRLNIEKRKEELVRP